MKSFTFGRIVLLTAALLLMQAFAVRELIAALLMFAVMFAAVALLGAWWVFVGHMIQQYLRNYHAARKAG